MNYGNKTHRAIVESLHKVYESYELDPAFVEGFNSLKEKKVSVGDLDTTIVTPFFDYMQKVVDFEYSKAVFYHNLYEDDDIPEKLTWTGLKAGKFWGENEKGIMFANMESNEVFPEIGEKVMSEIKYAYNMQNLNFIIKEGEGTEYYGGSLSMYNKKFYIEAGVDIHSNRGKYIAKSYRNSYYRI